MRSPAPHPTPSIRLYHAQTGDLVDEIFITCNCIAYANRQDGGCNCRLYSIAYNNALNVLYVGDCDNAIQCIDLETHKCFGFIPTNNAKICYFTLDEQEQTIHMIPHGANYKYEFDDNIMRWHIPTKTFLDPVNPNVMIDYGYLKSVNSSTPPVLFDYVYCLPWHNQPRNNLHPRLVSSFYVDHKNGLLFSGSQDCSIKIWNGDTNNKNVRLATLNGHANEITAFAFDPTSDTLYSKSYIMQRTLQPNSAVRYNCSSEKIQLKAWKPQCNLAEIQERFNTVDWVMLNTPPLTPLQKVRGQLKGLLQ